MKKKTYSRYRNLPEDSFDESEDYSDPGLNEPMYSPMRRKEKIRTKDFKTEKKHKDRKRNLRNKIRYDFEL
ncbi:MAG: hypothetical protein PVI82_01295 [Desulfobacterales bacterium]